MQGSTEHTAHTHSPSERSDFHAEPFTSWRLGLALTEDYRIWFQLYSGDQPVNSCNNRPSSYQYELHITPQIRLVGERYPSSSSFCRALVKQLCLCTEVHLEPFSLIYVTHFVLFSHKTCSLIRNGVLWLFAVISQRKWAKYAKQRPFLRAQQWNFNKTDEKARTSWELYSSHILYSRNITQSWNGSQKFGLDRISLAWGFLLRVLKITVYVLGFLKLHFVQNYQLISH